MSFDEHDVVIARQIGKSLFQREDSARSATLELLGWAAQDNGGSGTKEPVGVLVLLVDDESVGVVFDHGYSQS